MKQELVLRIVLENPPPGVDIGLQKGSGSNYETIQKQLSGSGNLAFEFPITVKFTENGVPNFLGAFVQGTPKDRFVYLDIGKCAGQANTIWSRRLKIPLRGISSSMMEELLVSSDSVLETKVPGTAKDNGPNCGTVKPFAGWYLSKTKAGN
jgi:Family of unknown function (DUF5990)